ncbi:MAG: retroviral-like aspartic protease family protein [Bacteroidales bacterium]|nr:retroviral-like aspartic protease family protein [Bacteroidales bacterium]
MKNVLFRIILIALIILVQVQIVGCNGCSPSGRHHLQQKTSSYNVHSKTVEKEHSHKVGGSYSKSVVQMRSKNGVYFIPVRLNGVDMEVIFDTGASDIVISSVEALFLLKQEKLSEEDIEGQAYYGIADGSVAVGTVINLRSVEIGDRVLYNVKATVVDNVEAPLLLGQSALARFGKVSINYNDNTIEFD